MMEDPFKSVRDQVRSELDMSASINNSELMARIEEMVWRRRELMELTAAEKRRLVRRVFDSFRGLDVLQPLVDNPRITEIMINSHQDIFIEQDGEVKKRRSIRIAEPPGGYHSEHCRYGKPGGERIHAHR